MSTPVSLNSSSLKPNLSFKSELILFMSSFLLRFSEESFIRTFILASSSSTEI